MVEVNNDASIWKKTRWLQAKMLQKHILSLKPAQELGQLSHLWTHEFSVRRN